MKGTNLLTVNLETVKDAMECYLNRNMIGRVTVEAIQFNQDDRERIITLEFTEYVDVRKLAAANAGTKTGGPNRESDQDITETLREA